MYNNNAILIKVFNVRNHDLGTEIRQGARHKSINITEAQSICSEIIQYTH